jgi:hypothetical protein
VTPVDLHPEDLLDGEMRGELSPAQSDRLKLHARHCDVCRFERRARADFRREAEGAGAEASLERLLASIVVPPPLYVRPRKRSAIRYWRVVAAAVAVIAVTALAAASRWSGGDPRRHRDVGGAGRPKRARGHRRGDAPRDVNHDRIRSPFA